VAEKVECWTRGIGVWGGAQDRTGTGHGIGQDRDAGTDMRAKLTRPGLQEDSELDKRLEVCE